MVFLDVALLLKGRFNFKGHNCSFVDIVSNYEYVVDYKW